MIEIEYIGKCLLVDKRILVIGDLHFGFGDAVRESGYLVGDSLYEDVIKDLSEVFGEVGDVEEVVFLGDLKHVFGKIMRDEWKHVLDILDYVGRRCNKIVVVKGNHDVLLDRVVKNKNVDIVDYYVSEDVCFLHGDRVFDIDEVNDCKTWIVGHGHPAVWLDDGVRKEKYKCYLVGKWKKKDIVIMPSFFPLTEGSDPREHDLGLAWDFKINKFEVKIVDGLDVRRFGILHDIK